MKGLDRRLLEKVRGEEKEKAEGSKKAAGGGATAGSLVKEVERARWSNVTTVASLAGYARRR